MTLEIMDKYLRCWKCNIGLTMTKDFKCIKYSINVDAEPEEFIFSHTSLTSMDDVNSFEERLIDVEVLIKDLTAEEKTLAASKEQQFNEEYEKA